MVSGQMPIVSDDPLISVGKRNKKERGGKTSRHWGSEAGSSLLLDVGTQLEDVLLAGRLELVGETEIFDLDLWRQTAG